MSEPPISPAPPPLPDSSLKRLIAAQRRQIRVVVAELVQMRGVMPLLMKNRNGGSWTREERDELLRQLRALSRLSPVLLLLLLPGSALLLPLYAWWLDRRRQARGANQGLPPDSLGK